MASVTASSDSFLFNSSPESNKKNHIFYLKEFCAGKNIYAIQVYRSIFYMLFVISNIINDIPLIKLDEKMKIVEYRLDL